MNIYIRKGRFLYGSEDSGLPYTCYYNGTYKTYVLEETAIQWIMRIMGMRYWEETELISFIEGSMKEFPQFKKLLEDTNATIKELLRAMVKENCISCYKGFTKGAALYALLKDISVEPSIRAFSIEEKYLDRENTPEYSLQKRSGSRMYVYDLYGITDTEKVVYEEIDDVFHSFSPSNRKIKYQPSFITLSSLAKTHNLSRYTKGEIGDAILSLINRGSLTCYDRYPAFSESAWKSEEDIPVQLIIPKED